MGRSACQMALPGFRKAITLALCLFFCMIPWVHTCCENGCYGNRGHYRRYACGLGGITVEHWCPEGTAHNCGRYRSGRVCDRCRDCGTGYYGGSSSCLPCPEGTYGIISRATRVTDCLECPDYTMSKPGQSSCTPCNEQEYDDEEHTKCTPCPSSTILNVGSKECSVCFNGTTLRNCTSDRFSLECAIGMAPQIQGKQAAPCAVTTHYVFCCAHSRPG